MKLNHKLSLFAALLLLLCAFDTARADKTDDLVGAQMRRRHIPGLALAVVRDGRFVKARGYGLANVELNVPVTTGTVFEIGSITKQITAAAVLLLVEEGKIGVDERVGKYLPNLPEAWNNVTVRHLLTHTSGVKNYTGLDGFELNAKLKRDEFVKRISAHPLNFAPGAQWSYSNTGYNLLGHIVEQVSGQTYWEFVNARIFRPLGMNSTRDRDPRFLVSNRADGYEWEDGALVGRDYDLTDVFSAGATLSTVLDLAKWDAALYNDRLLKSSSRAAMWSPVQLSGGKTHPYGFGWNTLTLRGHRLVSHGGQTAGFSAHIARFVDDRLTVVVLCNLGDIGLAGEVGRRVVKLYIPDLSLKSLKPPADPDPQATAMLRQALEDRIAGRLNPDSLTPNMRALLGSERGKEATRQLASYGTLLSFVFIEREVAANNERIARYRAVAGRHTLLLRFVLTEEGKLSAMNVEEEEE